MDDASFTQGVLDILARKGPQTTNDLRAVFLEKGEGVHPIKAQAAFSARMVKLQTDGFVASDPKLPGPDTQSFFEKSSTHEITESGRQKLQAIRQANARRHFGPEHIATLFPQPAATATNGDGTAHAHAPVTPLNCHIGARYRKGATATAVP
jgi:hypothetical protein